MAQSSSTMVIDLVPGTIDSPGVHTASAVGVGGLAGVAIGFPIRRHRDHFGMLAIADNAVADRDDPAHYADYWRAHVDGELVDVDVDIEHAAMGSAQGFGVIGPEVDRWLTALPAGHESLD